MIFAGYFCIQLRKLKALIRHALPGPDQVDIWDQVYSGAFWNDQIGNSELLRSPLVRKGRRFFDGDKMMKKDMHNIRILLSFWENIQIELATGKECPDKNKITAK